MTSMAVLPERGLQGKPRSDLKPAGHTSKWLSLLLHKHIHKYMHLTASALFLLVVGYLDGELKRMVTPPQYLIKPCNNRGRSVLVLPVLI